MTHLTSDQLIDALDGAADVNAHRHLESCADCRAQLERLSLALQATTNTAVPEPSPLFWDHFSARVRAAVDAEPAPSGEWSGWFRLPVLVPLAGLAILIATLAITLTRSTGPLPVEVAESQATDVVLNDEGWALVADAVGDLDWETATEVGLMVEPGAVDRVVMDLSVEEQRALTALLQAELRIKS